MAFVPSVSPSLSLALCLVSVVLHGAWVSASPRAIQLEVTHAGTSPGSGYLTLSCTLNTSLTVMTSIATLTVFGSTPYGGKNDFDQLAIVDMWSQSPKLSKNLEDTDVEVRGDTRASLDNQAYLLLTWNSPINGLRRSYRCVANGVDNEGQAVSVYTTEKVKTVASDYCQNMEPVTFALDVLDAKVENATKVTVEVAEDVTQIIEKKFKRLERKIEALEQRVGKEYRVLAIDKANFDVSTVFSGRVYLASKSVARFNIEAANDECIAAGGYLVEFDAPEEYSFVFDFVTTTGGANSFWTGGNDIDYEGRFVYYNSKKPVKGLVWAKNGPDNYGGSEDCMEIRLDFGGLNDWQCNQAGKYVCEVPLM